MTGLFSGRMLTPKLLPYLWIAGSLVMIVRAVVAVQSGFSILVAAVLVVLGVLLLGVLCETVLVLFRMLETLVGIDEYFHNYEKIIDQKFKMLDDRIQELKKFR